MKILFFGDSVTDAGRDRSEKAVGTPASYGYGFVRIIAGKLRRESSAYTVINRGINGNKTVDLYARVKQDVWNEAPDILTVLVGINDIAFDIKLNAGVEPQRYKKVYSAMLEETRERLPDAGIIVMEPFCGEGRETDGFTEEFGRLREYAAAVRELAAGYGARFIPLQADMEALAARVGWGEVLYDGVHPNVAGAELIAEKWLNVFNNLSGAAK